MVPDPFYVRLGEIIQARRKALGMKQKNLADAVAMSRGSLANIETGRQGVLVHQLYKFAKALEMQPHELLPPPTDRERSPELNKLMPSDLNLKQQDQLAGLIADASIAKGKEGENDRSTKK
jgi:transcriptional regulator with XRE-family HTH domain